MKCSSVHTISSWACRRAARYAAARAYAEMIELAKSELSYRAFFHRPLIPRAAVQRFRLQRFLLLLTACSRPSTYHVPVQTTQDLLFFIRARGPFIFTSSSVAISLQRALDRFVRLPELWRKIRTHH